MITPVVRSQTPQGVPAWLVTGRELVMSVLVDQRFGIAPPGSPGMGSLFTDGEPHARLRRLLARAFTARTVTALRPRIAALANNLVADLVKAGPGADVMATLTRPLPLAVIGDLLGVAEPDRLRFRRWADASLGVVAPDLVNPGGHTPGAEAAWGELSAFIGELIATTRVEPGDDLLSALIAVRDAEDGKLSDEELLTTTIALLTAGYLTVANALAIGLMHLLPTGQLPTLADEAAATRATEEVLRTQTGRAGEAMPRWAQLDLELAGQRINAGELVLVKLEAANHDPAEFPDPDRFDPARDPNRHLSFGHGAHHCLGAALARIELAEALRALAEQLPGLRLGCAPEEIVWTGNALDDGPTLVPVEW
ncbi:MAG TPA: cytochrome P450 [Pseudonocardiaceae bacterium]